MGMMLRKWQEHSFVSSNMYEAIIESWSARLYKSGLIQKIKLLKIRTKIVRDECGMCLMLHTPSIYYSHTNVELLGVLGIDFIHNF